MNAKAVQGKFQTYPDPAPVDPEKGMTPGQFQAEVLRRFDGIDKRLDGVERRLDDQQNQLASLATAFVKAGVVVEELRPDSEGGVARSVK